MGKLGLALIVGILLARGFLIWFETGGAQGAGLDLEQDPCDDWTEYFGLGECAGFSLGTLALGTIEGLPAPLQVLQSAVQTVVLVFSIRGLLAEGA